jgi:orotidine-5'-phosphate decarboxylase
MPTRYRDDPDGVLEFCCSIADAVADQVCAFKPQAAHFGALGAESQLQRLIAHLKRRHPDIPVILDAKRGDIGSTAERYAVEAYDRYGADAVTVNPLLGPESVQPYLARQDRGVVVLCRTSNADSGWLQDAPADDPLYLKVARAALDWNNNGNVMLVAGATYPEQLAAIRALVGDLPLLVPGVGSQGGDVRAVLEAGLTNAGTGLAINVSRAVLYASPGDDFAEAAAAKATLLREEINATRAALGNWVGAQQRG